MKRFFLLCFVLLAVCVCFKAYNLRSQESKDYVLEGLIVSNLEALAGGESGTVTGEIDCYNTYNSCWFWNCEQIWRCSGIDCYDVKCDSKSDLGKCQRKG